MITHENPVLLFGLLMVAANVVTTILVMVALDRRGIKTNLLLARLLIFKYLSQYRRVTIKETGKAGPLFAVWIATINLAAVSFAVLLFLAHNG